MLSARLRRDQKQILPSGKTFLIIFLENENINIFRKDKAGKVISTPGKLCHRWVRCVGRGLSSIGGSETSQGDRCSYTAHASCLSAQGIIEPVTSKLGLEDIVGRFSCSVFNHAPV